LHEKKQQKNVRTTWALLTPPTHHVDVMTKKTKMKHQQLSNLDLEFLVMAMVALTTTTTTVPTNERKTKWGREN
jgi:hypothetical protein